MLVRVAGFVLGVFLFQQMPMLPSAYWLLLLLPIAFSYRKLARFRVVMVVPAGFFWAFFHALWSQPSTLPPAMLENTVIARGSIQGIPDDNRHRARFYLHVDQLRQGETELTGNWVFRVSWYRQHPALTAGEVWHMPLRLKPVHGFGNPGGFDYAGWLYRQQVIYSGYVKGEAGFRGERCCSIDRLRQRISASIDNSDLSANAKAVMKALVVGDKSSLSRDSKQMFSATGTSHLIAISGLHIGMVATLFFLLAQRLWRFFPRLCSCLPAKIAAAPFAMLGACIYAALAGFSIPTQRALIMLLLMMLGMVWRRPVSSDRVLAMALFAVVVWDPYSVLSAGFWLSFIAVGTILYLLKQGTGRFGWLWLQLGIFFMLMPVLLWQQLPVSLLAPVINLLAIPLFAILIVPLSLVAAGLRVTVPSMGELPMQMIGWMLDRFLQGLAIATDYSPEVEWQLAAPWMLLILGLAAVSILFWRTGKSRNPLYRLLPISALLVSGVLLHQYRKPPMPNHFRFTLLDVGQGLSAVVRTANHSLIFDTGPKFPSGFNTGATVILPYLRSQGVPEVNRLVLSHSDIDHVGGAVDLLAGTKVGDILVGEPPGLGVSLDSRRCVAGELWWWDGVRFEILYPPADLREEGNNQSCVLRVSAAGDSVLLTGDIELPAEAWLLSHLPEKLTSSIVVAAHHGSSSSSSEAFVQASNPRYVLFSSGKNNRWGFPKEGVVKCWKKQGAFGLNTANSGAVEFELGSGKKPHPVVWVSESRRYWHK